MEEVFHYHVHLVPRYGDDDLVPPWRPTTPSPEVLAAIQRRIRVPSERPFRGADRFEADSLGANRSG